MQSNISRQRFLGTILTSFGYIKEANFLLSQRGKQIVANANIEPCHWQLEDATSNASSYSTTHISTHTHPFNGPLSGTTQVSCYQKGKTNLDFTEARDSGWQWHQLGYMQVCTSLQTDNHTSTPPLLCFLQAGCPSCRPTNSVKALKAPYITYTYQQTPANATSHK